MSGFRLESSAHQYAEGISISIPSCYQIECFHF